MVVTDDLRQRLMADETDKIMKPMNLRSLCGDGEAVGVHDSRMNDKTSERSISNNGRGKTLG